MATCAGPCRGAVCRPHSCKDFKFKGHADIEALVLSLAGEVREGDGSRVVFELHGSRKYLHRPHPGKEARKYQVEESGVVAKTGG